METNNNIIPNCNSRSITLPQTKAASSSIHIINIYYQNVRGLNTKLQDLSLAALTCNYDIYAFTETWLNSQVLNAEILSSNYNIIRCDRNFAETNKKKGGGVLIALNNKYVYDELNLSFIRETLPQIDIVGVKVTIHFQNIFVFILYVPPNTQHVSYESLFECIESLDYLNDEIIYFIGDFNIPEYNKDNIVPSNPATALYRFSEYLDMKQFNNVLNINETTLDLVLSNANCDVNRSLECLVIEDLHHPPLDISLEISSFQPENFPYNLTEMYNFKKANYPLLYESLFQTNWSFLTELNEVNIACTAFYSKLTEIFDKFVPKSIPKQPKYPTWYTNNIVRDIKKKHNLRKQYKKTKNEDDYNAFRNMREKIKQDVKQSYENYLVNIQDNIKNDPKKFWSYVNSKRNCSSIPDNITYNDVQHTNPQHIVNAFATFFQAAYLNPNTNSNKYPSSCYTDSNNLRLSMFSEKDVLKSLNKIKPKFTKGPDNIPAFIVKDCAHVFAEPLTIIFNLSLKLRVFPNVWKYSRLCPVYKKDNKYNAENYRPITIICNFAKVFEFTLNTALSRHVHGQIVINQHGFVPGRSTETNLTCVTQFVSEKLDDSKQVDIIYTDFSKAFDRLDHGILLGKLSKFGLSLALLDLITSYLENRRQYVEYRGYRSFDVLASSGVPQGSVLGPLLFNIFINDIVTELDVPSLLYADDLKIYYAIETEDDCVKLQDNLNKINDWCTLNLLSLNVSKCSAFTFCRARNHVSYNYHLNNQELQKPDTIKDLGVTFDRNLSFNEHVNLTVSSALKSLGFVIRNCKGFNNVDIMKLLYFSYVRSKLEYCSLVWSPGYATYINNIESIQRRFVKYLCFIEDGNYPTIGYSQSIMLERFDMSNLENRRIIHSIVFLYKIIHSIFDCPSILEQLHFRVPRIESRNRETFYLSTPRTNLLKLSPIHFMCKNYNSLQNELDIFNCSLASIRNLFSV